MSLESCPRVIIGGTLIDGKGNPPIKDSVVIIKDEWILATGELGKIEIPSGAELINVSGKTVVPGLIDAHTHFLKMGIRMISMIDLSDAKSLSECIEKIKTKTQESEKGEWIQGKGWDESKWTEKRYPTKNDFDEFSKDNPISLRRVCGHMLVLNTKALEIVGIAKDTPDPPGGQIDKGENGEPTGVIRDASHLVDPYIPPITQEQALEGLKLACDNALELGCTGVHEAGVDAFETLTYQKALERGLLKLKVYLMINDELIDAMKKMGLRTGFGNNMLKLGPVKMLIDGSLGARTAALFEPYEDDPSTKGLLLMPEEELKDKVLEVHKHNSQAAVHAIGDYGIEIAINAIENAIKNKPRKNHRHRIEHSELLGTNQIERMQKLGIIASMQPNFVGEWSGPEGLYETRIGSKRLRQNNPYRLLLDEGVHTPFGSDCMPFNPLYGIWSAVNHPIKSSRITLVEAIKSYTLDSAYASFEEDVKGSVEPGKLADITILEKDLTEISKNEIRDVSVYMTMINGKILYSSET